MPRTKLTLPLSEKEISQHIGRTIYSPVRIAGLSYLGIDKDKFVKVFSPLFAELPWDEYDSRRMKVELLKKLFPEDAKAIHQKFKAYYTGQTGFETYRHWYKKMKKKDKAKIDNILPWRRRSVATFSISKEKNTKKTKETEVRIVRKKVKAYVQDVSDDDFRSWPRIFKESPAHHIENGPFVTLLKQVFTLVQSIRPETKKIDVTAHFMSVKASPQKPGDNSPEGAHEDGADYIISALVINRINLKGGESQIIEHIEEKGKKEIIFHHTLAPGEFVFQADSRDEMTHGTDLWHHVTPFYPADKSIPEGWRDIIGFDINVVEEG